MKPCTNCAAMLEDHAKFCPKCGRARTSATKKLLIHDTPQAHAETAAYKPASVHKECPPRKKAHRPYKPASVHTEFASHEAEPLPAIAVPQVSEQSPAIPTSAEQQGFVPPSDVSHEQR